MRAHASAGTPKGESSVLQALDGAKLVLFSFYSDSCYGPFAPLETMSVVNVVVIVIVGFVVGDVGRLLSMLLNP